MKLKLSVVSVRLSGAAHEAPSLQGNSKDQAPISRTCGGAGDIEPSRVQFCATRRPGPVAPGRTGFNRKSKWVRSGPTKSGWPLQRLQLADYQSATQQATSLRYRSSGPTGPVAPGRNGFNRKSKWVRS